MGLLLLLILKSLGVLVDGVGMVVVVRMVSEREMWKKDAAIMPFLFPFPFPFPPPPNSRGKRDCFSGNRYFPFQSDEVASFACRSNLECGRCLYIE